VVKSLDVDHVVLCPLVDEPTECLEYVFDASEKRKRRKDQSIHQHTEHRTHLSKVG
jgi:hypothetical protein